MSNKQPYSVYQYKENQRSDSFFHLFLMNYNFIAECTYKTVNEQKKTATSCLLINHLSTFSKNYFGVFLIVFESFVSDSVQMLFLVHTFYAWFLMNSVLYHQIFLHSRRSVSMVQLNAFLNPYFAFVVSVHFWFWAYALSNDYYWYFLLVLVLWNSMTLREWLVQWDSWSSLYLFQLAVVIEYSNAFGGRSVHCSPFVSMRRMIRDLLIDDRWLTKEHFHA